MRFNALLSAALPLVTALVLVVLGGLAIQSFSSFSDDIHVQEAPPPPEERPSGRGQTTSPAAPPPADQAVQKPPQEPLTANSCKLPANAVVCAKVAYAGALHFSVTILLIAFAAGTVSIASSALRDGSSSPDAARRALRVGIVCAFLLLAALLYWFFSGQYLYEAIGNGVVGKTLLAVAGSAPNTSVVIAYSAAAFGAAAVAVGSMTETYAAIEGAKAALGKPDPADPAAAAVALNEEALRLGRSMADLRNLATAGALVLTAGVASVKLYFDWARPLAAMSGKGAEQSFQALSDGVVALHGAAYTTALFVIFYGSSALLGRFAAQLAEKLGHSSPAAVTKFYTEAGLAFTIPSAVKDALKVAAPALLGVFAEGGLSKILGLS